MLSDDLKLSHYALESARKQPLKSIHDNSDLLLWTSRKKCRKLAWKLLANIDCSWYIKFISMSLLCWLGRPFRKWLSRQHMCTQWALQQIRLPDVRELALKRNHWISRVWSCEIVQKWDGSWDSICTQETKHGDLSQTSVVDLRDQASFLRLCRHILVEAKWV